VIGGRAMVGSIFPDYRLVSDETFQILSNHGLRQLFSPFFEAIFVLIFPW
jgi:hypothetical protein